MGLMKTILSAFGFGGGRNVVAETIEVFRPNAEREAARSADYQHAALAQFATEFARQRRGWFDWLIDAVNRLPRPVMAMGTIGLLASAMIDPIWFGERMQGLALVPAELWWLLGAIVAFYFGARERLKDREAAVGAAEVGAVLQNIGAIRDLRPSEAGQADAGTDARAELAATTPQANPALQDWNARRS